MGWGGVGGAGRTRKACRQPVWPERRTTTVATPCSSERCTAVSTALAVRYSPFISGSPPSRMRVEPVSATTVGSPVPFCLPPRRSLKAVPSSRTPWVLWFSRSPSTQVAATTAAWCSSIPAACSRLEQKLRRASAL